MFFSNSIHKEILGRAVQFLTEARLCFLIGLFALGSLPMGQANELEVMPFLEQHCIKCHGGEKVKGKVDFTKVTSPAAIDANFELWETAADALEYEEMPPEDEPQPTAAEREVFLNWYQQRFVKSVQAKPAPFKPRRLSAAEYRNTLRSLFGFDLEVAIIEAEQTIVEKSMVMKLLPTDPPGKSGFTNDTYGNPLSTVIWERYSYLADSILEELFAKKHRSQLRALSGPVSDQGFSEANAIRLIDTLLPRIFRRSLKPADLEKVKTPLMGKSGRQLVRAVKSEIKVALMSPGFIYRGVLMQGQPGKQQAVDEFELAERLSYFLWGDMPDEQLMKLAANRSLAEPEVFAAQLTRMLDSPKSRQLADSFAVQWLSLNEIDHVSDNPPFTMALKTQPIDFMDYLIREDRPLLELIDSKTAFINPLTAKFYGKDRKQMAAYKKQKGIEVEAVKNSKITLQHAEGRGGLLTIPGVLAMNRGPVLRGTWMLERIMGDHLSDPPANVGVVKKNSGGESLSFRERFEQHRSNAACALCHDKIDPFGFAMQAYDEAGAFVLAQGYQSKKKKGNKGQQKYAGGEFDTSGELPSGEKFQDFAELKKILMSSQREAVIRNIVQRTLAYALCRKLEIYDRPTVEDITAQLNQSNGSWRDLVKAVSHSLPFRQTILESEKS